MQFALRRSLCGSQRRERGQPAFDNRLTAHRLGEWHRTGFRRRQYRVERALEELTEMSPRRAEKVLAAPEQLSLESRTSFRRLATELLEQMAEGSGRLVIDLSGTRHVDSAGLGSLMLIQRKAAERRQTVCLRGANEELRFLLVLTKLDDLFELESGGP